MNFFAQEIQTIIRKVPALKGAKASCIGRACYIELPEGRRIKIAFDYKTTTSEFDIITLTALDKREGKIDTQRLLLLADFCAKRPLKSGGEPRLPHIWENGGKADWYGPAPTEAEQKALATAISEYTALFS